MQSPEVNLQLLLIAGTILAILGIMLGWWIGRRTSAVSQKYREVERRLDQVLQDKKLYEDDVVEHFTETAKLLNSLTESYRDVHNHLAQGASTLCQDKGPISLERLDDKRNAAEIPARLAQVHPPLDYAPKSSPNEKGMLNEEFGLERKAEIAAATAKSGKA